jgi:cytoskeletal protein CcmA (bactofilin family)
MFSKDKNNIAPDRVGNSATLISAGTILKGDVRSESDLRIDGTIHGNVFSSAKIVVGPTGFVEGHISSRQADITGKVAGNITVDELLQLRGECNVNGSIAAATLQIDPTAVFNGKCEMGGKGSVVQMAASDGATAEAK